MTLTLIALSALVLAGMAALGVNQPQTQKVAVRARR